MEKVSAAITALDQALAAGQSEALERWLKVQSHFHPYSLNNVMLIMLQFPEASHVAGYTTWQQLGRQVRRGEKGIAIQAPVKYRAKKSQADEEDVVIRCMKIVYVFDISQTEGEPLLGLSEIVGYPKDNIARLEQVIEDRKLTLVYDSQLPSGRRKM
jgi:antirestriction protein ArdC